MASGLLGVPVNVRDGWQAPLAEHFALADWFALVSGGQIVTWLDARDLSCEERAQHLQAESAVLVVTRAIGADGLSALSQAGIAVLRSDAASLREAVLAVMTGAVDPLRDVSCCGRHRGGACAGVAASA